MKQSSGETRRENAKACLRAELRATNSISQGGQSGSVPTPCCLWREIVGTALCAFAHSTALPLGCALAHCNDGGESGRHNSALVPRTQRSASLAVRCRAGAHAASYGVAF